MHAYRNIMVHVPLHADDGARVALAADLARRFDAQLTGIAAGCLRMPLGAGVGGEALARIIALEDEELEGAFHEASARFRHHAGGVVRDLQWHGCAELPITALAREARAADLLVVGRGKDGEDGSSHVPLDPGDLVMQAGRPVLLVPPGLGHLKASRILVAWTDVREARRAVLDALPVLGQADHVEVLEICGDVSTMSASLRQVEGVAEYLRCHGVKAVGHVCRLTEFTVADQLMTMAELVHADLVVAGAYGHARPREWMFGGVTHALMSRATCCCLLSH